MRNSTKKLFLLNPEENGGRQIQPSKVQGEL